MVLQASISLIYGVIQSSWMISAVLLKYILAAQVAFVLRQEGDFIENFRSEVDEHSAEIVSGMVLLGILNMIIGVELSTYPTLLSYSVAVIYYGYLFWEF